MSNGRTAIVFPGQGSQRQGMGKDFYESIPECRRIYEEASDALGWDVAALCFGEDEKLNLTAYAQPSIVVTEIAMLKAIMEKYGITPDVFGGHSLGEYTALVAAGAIAFEDALPLVRFRAQVMQEAVPPGAGAMAAILGADDDVVRAACAEAAQGDVVEPVNFNAPGQVVIAGSAAAVDRAIDAVKARGAKRAVKLPVSAPFHSSLLAPAAARLREKLATVPVASPRIPVIHNYDVATHQSPDEIRAVLVAQADHPVRWVETIRAIGARGATLVAESGPGKVLAPLVRRIDDRLQGVALADRAAIEQAIAQTKE